MATVANGNVTGVAPGITVITAIAGEKSVDCMVTVVGETYDIRTPEVEGASIAVTGEKRKAAAGEAVAFRVEIAKEDKYIDSVNVISDQEEEVSLYEDNGNYSFIMPASAVTVHVTLKDIPSARISVGDTKGV